MTGGLPRHILLALERDQHRGPDGHQGREDDEDRHRTLVSRLSRVLREGMKEPEVVDFCGLSALLSFIRVMRNTPAIKVRLIAASIRANAAARPKSQPDPADGVEEIADHLGRGSRPAAGQAEDHADPVYAAQREAEQRHPHGRQDQRNGNVAGGLPATAPSMRLLSMTSLGTVWNAASSRKHDGRRTPDTARIK